MRQHVSVDVLQDFSGSVLIFKAALLYQCRRHVFREGTSISFSLLPKFTHQDMEDLLLRWKGGETLKVEKGKASFFRVPDRRVLVLAS
jgi:hypothetical protein